jgi:hypothetical protein
MKRNMNRQRTAQMKIHHKHAYEINSRVGAIGNKELAQAFINTMGDEIEETKVRINTQLAQSKKPNVANLAAFVLKPTNRVRVVLVRHELEPDNWNIVLNDTGLLSVKKLKLIKEDQLQVIKDNEEGDVANFNREFVNIIDILLREKKILNKLEGDEYNEQYKLCMVLYVHLEQGIDQIMKLP